MPSTPQVVILVHGIQSNGAWHDAVAEVLEPFFTCHPIKYREYHSLGPVTIFFWLWAIPLAGILGWWTLQLSVPDWARWGFLGGVALAALAAAYFSGLARALPFMIVGSFCASALEDATLSATLTMVWLAATTIVSFAGDWRRNARWRTALEKVVAEGDAPATPEARHRVEVARAELPFALPGHWAVASGLLSLAAVVLAAVVWVAGALFRHYLLDWLLPASVFLCSAFVLWRESDWAARDKELRKLRFWKRAPHLFPLTLLTVLLILAPFWLSRTAGNTLLWFGLVGFMLFLEWAEAAGGAELRCPRSVWWHLWVVLVALLTCAAWVAASWWPWSGLLSAAILLAFGWREPVWRIERATEHLNECIRRDRNILEERPSLIAHSLGTFLSCETFKEYDLGFRLSYDRVLLVGAAVSEKFDWEPFLAGRRISQVRNERGGMDLVINLLRLSGGWARKRGLGGAGYYGLLPPATPYHDVENHRLACRRCLGAASLSRVHNYVLERFWHSTGTLRRDHAFDYWLPYLWGHSPEDWYGFLEACRNLFRAWLDRARNKKDYRVEIEGLKQKKWSWDGDEHAPRPLTEYVHDEIAAQLDLLDCAYPTLPVLPSRLVQDAAAVILAQVVAKAVVLHEKGSTSVEDLRLLIPLEAIRHAALTAYSEVARRLEAGERPGPAGFAEPCLAGGA